MLIRNKPDLTDNDVTPESLYRQRRRFIQSGFALAAGTLVPGLGVHAATLEGDAFKGLGSSEFSTDEELTPFDAIASYNNFYEFGLDKDSPKELAKDMKTRPWEIAIEGECKNPMTIGIEDLLADFDMEERIYRLRCVEAWSMVVPWVGFPLSALLEKVEPTQNAKYVEFHTLHDPEQMPGQRRGLFGYVLDWPYVEGLRMDEATNPLTLLATGLYGKVLPNQNGAPIRLVVPWKYGFKSIKSIVTIRLVEKQPLNTWQQQAPSEYGFYANVNPAVDHPRWSQAKERRIGEILRRDTLPFNGYAEQVASLYNGMDPKNLF